MRSQAFCSHSLTVRYLQPESRNKCADCKTVGQTEKGEILNFLVKIKMDMAGAWRLISKVSSLGQRCKQELRTELLSHTLILGNASGTRPTPAGRLEGRGLAKFARGQHGQVAARWVEAGPLAALLLASGAVSDQRLLGHESRRSGDCSMLPAGNCSGIVWAMSLGA